MSDATMGFWDQFLPGFLSTLVGVALGIPAGLLIAWLSQRQAAKAQLENAIDIVRESIETNRNALKDLGTVLDAGWVRPDTDLSAASWVAVQKDALSGLRAKLALRAALVSFFEGLERLIALNQLLLDQNVGVNAAMQSSGSVAGQIRDEMKRRCAALYEEAGRIATELR